MNLTKAINKRINDIPMLSVVATRLLEISGDERVSLKDIVKIVEKDAYLTARILRIANSVTFSRGRSISTIGDAIVRLGEKTVVGVAMESSTTFFKQPLSGYESPAGELWNHSLYTAIAAREVSRFAITPLNPELSYTAGLMHDIGKPIISDFLAVNVKDLTSRCDSHQVEDFAAAERDVMGMDHAEAGLELAVHWKLPEPLRMAIRWHHEPAHCKPSYQGLAYTIHIADILAMMEGGGLGADFLSYKMDPEYKRFVKIGKTDIAAMLLVMRDEFIKTQQLIFGGK
jgi:putative nucleotidyltransferase with HDIG domain